MLKNIGYAFEITAVQAVGVGCMKAMDCTLRVQACQDIQAVIDASHHNYSKKLAEIRSI
jgi:hypothetical protein